MKRLSTYLGPLGDSTPEQLAAFDLMGEYVCEKKKDGIWAQLDLINLSLVTRTGQNAGEELLDALDGIKHPLKDLVLIGELMEKTPAAIKERARIGHPCIWIHDIISCNGQDTRQSPLEIRHKILRELVHSSFDGKVKRHMPLVEQTTKNFLDFYKQTLKDGGEGVVVKKLTSKYRAARSDGKTNSWIRVKPFNDIDYYIMGPDEIAGGELTVRLGLWGQKEHVLRCQIPGVSLVNGKLCVIKGNEALSVEGMVITMRGHEVFDSGSLRDAKFLCWRPDKTKEMCTTK